MNLDRDVKGKKDASSELNHQFISRRFQVTKQQLERKKYAFKLGSFGFYSFILHVMFYTISLYIFLAGCCLLPMSGLPI